MIQKTAYLQSLSGPRFFWFFLTVVLSLFPLVAFIYPRALGSVFPALGLIFGCIAFFMPETGRSSVFNLKFLSVILGTVLGICFASSLWSLNVQDTLERCLKLSFLFAGGIGALFAASKLPDEHVEKLGWGLVVAVGLITVLLPIEYYTKHALYKISRSLPLDISLPHSVNNHACVFLLSLMWPVFLFLKRRKSLNALGASVLLLVPLLSTLIFGRQDGSIIGFLLGGVVFLALISPYRKTFLGVGSAVFVVFVLSTPWLMQFMYTGLIDYVAHVKHINADVRLEIWSAVAEKSREQLFVGHGVEAARSIRDFPFAGVYFTSRGILHPHNAILQIWLELGLLGISALLGLLGFLAVFFWKKMRGFSRPAAFALLTMLLFIATVDYGIWQSWWIGLIFYICAVFYSLSRRDGTGEL